MKPMQNDINDVLSTRSPHDTVRSSFSCPLAVAATYGSGGCGDDHEDDVHALPRSDLGDVIYGQGPPRRLRRWGFTNDSWA